ncbi:hypothetical protein [Chitinivorax sp. B]|uniref:hypothetical protein n=1 Tax=Chitinivorax sp. B TaxID=2502235 RepID=UPI0010F8C5ED|nr:hypothetical protein [Chitinivorax sp. B]
MTTPISSVGNLAAIVSVIRKQLAETKSHQRARHRPSGASGKSHTPSRSIEQRVATSLSAIAHDDPDRGRKGIKAFIEAILLKELGEHLMNDPAFYQMADVITDQILQSPGLVDAVNAAIAHLTTDGVSPAA